MSEGFHNVNIRPLLEQLEEVIFESNETFGVLSQKQMVWKPLKSQWSIRECLDHIMTTNASYAPQFDRILSGSYHPTFWQKMPRAWHNFWGQKLVEHLGPEVRRKSKTPGIFKPSAGRLNQHIARDFISSLKLLSEKIASLDVVDHTAVIITSPASKIVTYSLYDTLEIIVGHTRRHVNQAKNLMGLPGFPNS